MATDLSDPIGLWYFAISTGKAVDLVDTPHSVVRVSNLNSLEGTLANEMDGSLSPLSALKWNSTSRVFEFTRLAGKTIERYSGIISEGVFVGRLYRDNFPPTSPEQYRLHVTGWNSEYIDRDIFPRVHEIRTTDRRGIRVRLDRGAAGGIIGRLKVYNNPNRSDPNSPFDELEDELELAWWDGKIFRVVRRLSDGTGSEEFYGRVPDEPHRQRFLVGTVQRFGPDNKPISGIVSWEGYRAEVLFFGLSPKKSADRITWQARTRTQLRALIMATGPAPTKTAGKTSGPMMAPPALNMTSDYFRNRDDNVTSYSQKIYRVHDVSLTLDVKSPLPTVLASKAAVTRSITGKLAYPYGIPPNGLFRPVLVLNGHGGSANGMFEMTSQYWYGDAFARRGYVVLAIEVGHRPKTDRSALYPDPDSAFPSIKPAIRSPGFDSDWEECGERAWDAMRGIDYLLALQNVDPTCLTVVGLSMGGEMASYVGALDTRVKNVICAGYPWDLTVMRLAGNHNCFRWINADITEYVSNSDFLSLVAPRGLLVEMGLGDDLEPRRGYIYSKVNVRQAHAAFNDSNVHYNPWLYNPSSLFHYVHDAAHMFRAGDVSVKQNPALAKGIRVPDLFQPTKPGDTKWQEDPATHPLGSDMTIFDLIDYLCSPQQYSERVYGAGDGSDGNERRPAAAIVPPVVSTSEVIIHPTTIPADPRTISFDPGPPRPGDAVMLTASAPLLAELQVITTIVPPGEADVVIAPMETWPEEASRTTSAGGSPLPSESAASSGFAWSGRGEIATAAKLGVVDDGAASLRSPETRDVQAMEVPTQADGERAAKGC